MKIFIKKSFQQLEILWKKSFFKNFQVQNCNWIILRLQIFFNNKIFYFHVSDTFSVKTDAVARAVTGQF
jgi:hypothetical protein